MTVKHCKFKILKAILWVHKQPLMTIMAAILALGQRGCLENNKLRRLQGPQPLVLVFVRRKFQRNGKCSHLFVGINVGFSGMNISETDSFQITTNSLLKVETHFLLFFFLEALNGSNPRPSTLKSKAILSDRIKGISQILIFLNKPRCSQ